MSGLSSAALANAQGPKVVEAVMDGAAHMVTPVFLTYGLVIQNDTDQPITITGDRPNQSWECEAGQTYIGAIDTPSRVHTYRSAGAASVGICLLMFYPDRIFSGGQGNVVTRPNSNIAYDTVTSTHDMVVVLARPSAYVTVCLLGNAPAGYFNAAIYLPPVNLVSGPRIPLAVNVPIIANRDNVDVPPWTWPHPVPFGAAVRVWGAGGLTLVGY